MYDRAWTAVVKCRVDGVVCVGEVVGDVINVGDVVGFCRAVVVGAAAAVDVVIGGISVVVDVDIVICGGGAAKITGIAIAVLEAESLNTNCW